MKLLLSSGCLHGDFKTIFECCANYDFDGIELYLERPSDFHTLNFDIIQGLSLSYGKPVYTIHMPSYERYLYEFFSNRYATTLRVFAKSKKLMEQFGAKVLVVHPWPYIFFRRAALKKFQKALYEIFKNEDGSPLPFSIGLEILPTIGRRPFTLAPHVLKTPEHFRAFCHENKYHTVLDTTHCRSLNLPPEKFYAVNRDLLVNIHFSDYKNGIQHLPPGWGDTNFEPLFQNLREDNYEGFVTLELIPNRFGGKPEVIGECKKLMDKLAGR